MPGEAGNMGDSAALLFSDQGLFSNIYNTIKSKLGNEKIKKIAKASTAERLQILASIPEANFQPKAHTSIKDEAKALEFKEIGNQNYRENKYGEAYKFYTQALQYCPVNLDNPTDPANKQYSIIWANRSASLDGVGLYAACIHDVEMALKFGYPREYWYKLYKRKGHAHIKMKQYLLAKEALETSLKNVGRSDIKKEKDRDNYRMRVRKQMTIFNVTKSLYNVEKYEQFDSTLADGQPTDSGLSSKVSMEEDGDRCQIVAAKDVHQEENLATLDPYVTVVNVSGGRAGGKICPYTMGRLFSPVPCRFGSEEIFESETARDEAANSYHQYEWKILPNLAAMKLLERVKLALRMVTCLSREDVNNVISLIDDTKAAPEDRLKLAVNTFRLPTDNVRDEDELLASVVGLYLLKNLMVSDYIEVGEGLSKQELNVYKLLTKAVLVALKHTKDIKLMHVLADKKKALDSDIETDTCAYGIYPDLHNIHKYSSGEESHVIEWFSTKKLVFTSFRKIEKGKPVYFFTDENKAAQSKAKQKDLTYITFRCGNDLCTNSFPLKENTKEKVITCPLDDCGLKTNIWDRLRQIQKLKKDFASGKEELEKGDVELSKEIFRDCIDDWDRMIIRPYRELIAVEFAYVKTLYHERGDRERMLVEGNQMGKIVNKNRAIDPMKPPPEEGEEITSKMIEINKVK